jgi:hypothetical protein
MNRMNVIMNHNLKARKRENRKKAAEMGLTLTEFGLLSYAHLEAELSAKANETVEQTNARAKAIWHKEVEDWRAEEKRLTDTITSLPDEKERRKLLARMRSSSSSSSSNSRM